MRAKNGWWVAAMLVAPAAQAQVPTLLPGRWQVYEIGFLATGALSDSVRDRLDDPQVADLNVAIMRGEAQLVVEFRADGTYAFTITRDGERTRSETGTYTLQNNSLQARSPAPDGASFHGQHLARLTKRTLVLTFPVGPAMPGVVEEIAYRRLK